MTKKDVYKLVEEHLKFRAAEGLAKSTITFYKSRLRLWVEATDGDLSPEKVVEYQIDVIDKHSQSASAYMGAVHRFIEWLAKRGLWDYDLDLLPASPKGTDPKAASVAQEKTLQALLPIVMPKYKVALLLMARLGLRISDVLQLQWSDVDFGNKTIFIPRRKGGKSATLRYDVSDDLEAILNENRRDWGYILYGGDKNRSLRPGSVRNYLHAKTKDLGIPRLLPHGLRRMFAHNMAMSGVPVPTIGNVLGHVSTKTTDMYLREMGGVNYDGVDVLRAANQAAIEGRW